MIGHISEQSKLIATQLHNNLSAIYYPKLFYIYIYYQIEMIVDGVGKIMVLLQPQSPGFIRSSNDWLVTPPGFPGTRA